MNEIFNILIRNELTPNQFYLLYAILDRKTTPLINLSMELKILKNKEWILETGEVSPKAKRLVKEIDTFFKTVQEKQDKHKLGDDFKANIEVYNNLWPKMKLPSGKASRSSLSNLESPFRWFFENHKYSWDLIIKATNAYLDEKAGNNWNYTRTSQYFVRKQSTDKTWSSELADYCQLVEDGAELPSGSDFKEKVF